MANARARHTNPSTLMMLLCCLGAGLAWLGRAEVTANHVQPRHVHTIPLAGPVFGAIPRVVDINHQTDRLYVLEPRRNLATPGRVLALDLATETVVSTAPHPDSGFSSAHLAAEEGRNRVFVSGRFRVWVHDGGTFAVIGFINVAGPRAARPGGGRGERLAVRLRRLHGGGGSERRSVPSPRSGAEGSGGGCR